MQQVQLLISGLVQGVAFRAYTRVEANNLGLKGYVRNLPDGRVEVLAEGDRKALEKLVQWTYRGSPVSRVDDVTAKYSDATGDFRDFQVTF